MSHESDVVVIGAGHNCMIAAAYLAKAGLDVTVVERRPIIGGDTVTEELTLPGFMHDTCSSAHVVIQNNPLIRQNELNLDRYGLRYLYPERAVMMPFLDGRSLSIWLDKERTVKEFARYSQRDARAYLELLEDWQQMRAAFGKERNNAPTGIPSPELAAEKAKRAVDVVQERFENPYVRAFMGWISTLTMDPVTRPGTGLLPFTIASGRQEYSWTTPEGGSIALPMACARLIEEQGGRIVTGAPVTRILTEGGRAVGVEAGGHVYRARQAVLCGAHLKQIPGLLGQEATPADFRAGAERWRAGLTFFVIHLALNEAPMYRTENGFEPCTAVGTAESLENLVESEHAFMAGKIHLDDVCLLCVNSTHADPRRAPDGKHTYKVIGIFPYDLAEGPEQWASIKEDVADEVLARLQRWAPNVNKQNILARVVESPPDLETFNPNNWHGSCHGGATDPDQVGLNRPVAGYANYRGPVAGLYMTGAFTHPGGSVSGAPGRNAARAILDDLSRPWPAQGR